MYSNNCYSSSNCYSNNQVQNYSSYNPDQNQSYNLSGENYAIQSCATSSDETGSHASLSLDTLICSTPMSNYQSQQSNHANHAAERKETYHSDSFSFWYQQNINTYSSSSQRIEYHAVDGFLKLYRPQTQFIEAAEEIEGFVREIFEKTTGKQFPDDIIINVLDKDDLKAVHQATNSLWSDNIQGFSINSRAYKQVFVKKAELDRVLLVTGHEIGHVLTPTLPNQHDEEAKAFAFEAAWVDTILKHNIANLRENFTLDFSPAQNGLHDVAALFVKRLIKKGEEALEIYYQVAKRALSIVGS